MFFLLHSDKTNLLDHSKVGFAMLMQALRKHILQKSINVPLLRDLGFSVEENNNLGAS